MLNSGCKMLLVGSLCIFYFCLPTFVGSNGSPACDSNPIFCSGPVLEAVQMAHVFPDSKTFVDMVIKDNPQAVLDAFDQLKQEGKLETKEELADFVQTYFSPPGEELEEWNPPDWTPNPALLNHIKDPTYRKWAVDLTKLWKVLGRKMKAQVGENPERHSLIYVPNPFIIPGDRFREFYYWDSFWIVKGLLLSDMHKTVKGMLENFLHLVDKIGHVPNGGRIYFLQRSQPPMLLPMVDLYYQATQDLDFIRDSITLLEKEYMFWKNNRNVSVTVSREDGSGEETMHLTRYSVDMGQPRPEGYAEDIVLAQNFTGKDKEEKYADIASACESGWDFSTRWFEHHGEHNFKLESIKTRDIIPVDLNAIMLWGEHLLSKFNGLLGDAQKESMYRKRAERRAVVMNHIMWNEDMGIWLDYDLKMEKQRDQFYVSNVVPLLTMRIAQIEGLDDKAEKVSHYLQSEYVLTYPGGVPSSKIPSNQQWDFPNAWAPLVYFIVEALAMCKEPDTQALALNVSQVWLASNFDAWNTHGYMFEKYDVRHRGAVGGGGEYSVQTGFGWTNGVILHLLNRYGNQTTIPHHTVTQTGPPVTSSSVYIIVIVLVIAVAGLAVLLVIYMRRRRARRNPPSPRQGNKVYVPCTVKLEESSR